jgi:hypothetical protein
VGILLNLPIHGAVAGALFLAAFVIAHSPSSRVNEMFSELMLLLYIFYYVVSFIMLAMITFWVARLARPRQGILLAPCPDCGERISRRAEACPHCGRPEPLA